jgi:hypothetical protein
MVDDVIGIGTLIEALVGDLDICFGTYSWHMVEALH